jgi:hypothetical protein
MTVVATGLSVVPLTTTVLTIDLRPTDPELQEDPALMTGPMTVAETGLSAVQQATTASTIALLLTDPELQADPDSTTDRLPTDLEIPKAVSTTGPMNVVETSLSGVPLKPAVLVIHRTSAQAQGRPSQNLATT